MRSGMLLIGFFCVLQMRSAVVGHVKRWSHSRFLPVMSPIYTICLHKNLRSDKTDRSSRKLTVNLNETKVRIAVFAGCLVLRHLHQTPRSYNATNLLLP